MKTTILLLLISHTCFAQGVERWTVKTLADHPSPSESVRSTVAKESALARPSGSWLKLPRQASERQVVKVTGMITAVGEEADRDYHLVLSDGGKTMIVEIPDPVVCKGNAHCQSWATARAFIDRHVKVSRQIKPIKIPFTVTVTGVRFFDKPDHGTGHSTSGVELHPVLLLEEH